MAEITSTKDLKRVLDRKDLLSIGIGETVGAGIFALLGVGIGMTGKSITISLLVAACYVMVMAIPMILVSGTIRLRGGMYTQLGFLVNKQCSGFFIIVHLIAWSAIAMYAISFADYLLALVPGLNKTLVAFGMLTVFYVTNLFGVKNAAKVQTVMMVFMAIALTSFVVCGLPQVQPGYFTAPDFMTNGLFGVLSAGALMTWSVGGSTVVIHLGAEAKNPTRDVPFVIVTATLIVAVFYSMMATVAAGVLPTEQVVGKPLTLVAQQIMPRPLYIFFIVGGAMFALTTTLNAVLSWVTKPILQACVDGWFPKWIGAVNDKYKTPHVILTLLYLESLAAIFFNLRISTLANMAVILNNVLFALVCFSAIRMETVIPEIWTKSKFHVSHGKLIVLSIIGGLVPLAQNLLLFGTLKPYEFVGNVVVMIVAILYAVLREKSGHVNMEVSYEAE